MGRMREYFGRAFIGILDNSLRITIYNDDYHEDGTLKKLDCTVENEDELKQMQTYLNTKVQLKITGAKTKKRKEEFNFNQNIYISKITPTTNIYNNISFAIEILK